MRVKILIFPAALAISIAVIIGWIWPQYHKILNERDDLKRSEKLLAETKQKKQNMENLIESLNQNKDKESFVLSFLPLKRNEEEVINGLNYLATSSGVSINSISIEEKQNVEAKVSESESSTSKDILFSSSPNANNSPTAIPAPKVRPIKFKVSVSGSYENIRTYLEQIHKMEMYNDLISYTISSSKQNQETNQTAASPSILVATLEIDFGSLNKIQAGSNFSDAVFSNNSLNLNIYNKLISLVSKNIPVIEVNEEGRANPFLP